MSPRKLILRARLAVWAFRNPDRLTMLHFEMLRDHALANERAYAAECLGRQSEQAMETGRALLAYRVAVLLGDMPGAAENRVAL
jgi:hypothetical protein